MFNTAVCTSRESLLTPLRRSTMVLATWVLVTHRLLVQAKVHLQLLCLTRGSIVLMGPLGRQPHMDSFLTCPCLFLLETHR